KALSRGLYPGACGLPSSLPSSVLFLGKSGTSRSIVPRATSSSAEGLVTCDSAARVKKRRLNQSTCTNSDIPLWLNTRKPPARKDGPLHHPTKDKTNLILYIMCGVLAVMLVGIFTKLGLEKAHRRQRKPSPGPAPLRQALGQCAFEEARIAFREDEQGPGEWRSQASNRDSLRPEHRYLDH
uniref:Uncharacterized protein n=1 Tax=Felis catus TaxID=9685 RepID=A0ABI7XU51_FELCA